MVVDEMETVEITNFRRRFRAPRRSGRSRPTLRSQSTLSRAGGSSTRSGRRSKDIRHMQSVCVLSNILSYCLVSFKLLGCTVSIWSKPISKETTKHVKGERAAEIKGCGETCDKAESYPLTLAVMKVNV